MVISYNSGSRRDRNFQYLTNIILSMLYVSRKGHAIDIPCSLVVALGKRARASDPPPPLLTYIVCHLLVIFFNFEMIT